jgi:Cof subfamily protein (haloacid dehalogenase superfamily)
MYKMLAIDIDDTLINDDKQITPKTKHALTEAIAQGVIVTLATGRMHASAKDVAKQLELNVPLITYQGSWIKNALDGQVLYERAVPLDAAKVIFDYCTNNELHLQAYIDDLLYVKESSPKADDYAALSRIPYTVYPEFDELASKPSTKLLMIDEPEKLDQVAVELKGLLGEQVHITKSKPHFLEVTHPEGTKGHALTHLANHFGIELSEVIGIGDSWNDREMLEVAGLGVAMANAVSSLKEIANYITLSNNEDGVGHVIEKYILQPASH